MDLFVGAKLLIFVEISPRFCLGKELCRGVGERGSAGTKSGATLVWRSPAVDSSGCIFRNFWRNHRLPMSGQFFAFGAQFFCIRRAALVLFDVLFLGAYNVHSLFGVSNAATAEVVDLFF